LRDSAQGLRAAIRGRRGRTVGLGATLHSGSEVESPAPHSWRNVCVRALERIDIIGARGGPRGYNHCYSSRRLAPGVNDLRDDQVVARRVREDVQTELAGIRGDNAVVPRPDDCNCPSSRERIRGGHVEAKTHSSRRPHRQDYDAASP